MKNIFIYPNTQKKEINETINTLFDFISAHGGKILMDKELLCKQYEQFDIEFLEYSTCIEKADFIIVLGGDGTILRIAKDAAKSNTPILGINYGHIGFICELDILEYEYISKILTGDYIKDNRMMLEVRVVRGGTIIYKDFALNDVIITKGNVFRMVHVNVSADDVPVSTFSGDGVIISTPTGSTAYSLSAGAPVIEPSAENICVTPICAHALQAKSYVFAPQRNIEINAGRDNGNEVFASVDGKEGFRILPQDRVFITKAKKELTLIRVKGKSFYSVLKEKL